MPLNKETKSNHSVHTIQFNVEGYFVDSQNFLLCLSIAPEIHQPENEEMDTRNRVQIPDNAVCISYNANTLIKGMNSTIPTSYGKIVGQTWFVYLVMAINLERKLNSNQMLLLATEVKGD